MVLEGLGLGMSVKISHYRPNLKAVPPWKEMKEGEDGV